MDASPPTPGPRGRNLRLWESGSSGVRTRPRAQHPAPTPRPRSEPWRTTVRSATGTGSLGGLNSKNVGYARGHLGTESGTGFPRCHPRVELPCPTHLSQVRAAGRSLRGEAGRGGARPSSSWLGVGGSRGAGAGRLGSQVSTGVGQAAEPVWSRDLLLPLRKSFARGGRRDDASRALRVARPLTLPIANCHKLGATAPRCPHHSAFDAGLVPGVPTHRIVLPTVFILGIAVFVISKYLPVKGHGLMSFSFQFAWFGLGMCLSRGGQKVG